MRIHKILNNNVAVVIEENLEKIVMGRGICFGKSIGDDLSDKKIDKTFLLSSDEVSSKFQQLIQDVPMEYVVLGEEIIQSAKLKLGKKLNDMIFVSLIDHIYFSIKRFQEGALIKNDLLWDIKHFYPYEFELGVDVLERIKKQFDYQLPYEEAGFIAMHFVNAEENNDSNMYELTEVMQGICNIVKYTFHVHFDEEDVYYYRFITHLKFFAKRLVSHTTYEDKRDDGLLEVIKERYHNAYNCVCKIETYLSTQYHYLLSSEEKMYLTIHIERVIYKSKKNGI